MKEEVREVYIGLGANLGNPYLQLIEALDKIKAHPLISQMLVSRFYQTTPVGPIPQPDFLNAVCRVETTLVSTDLWDFLADMQKQMGQKPKPRNAPRLIDLDILFFGDESVDTADLHIPHPRLHERLFVLQPLSDLTNRVGAFNVQEALQNFPNFNEEKVVLYEGSQCKKLFNRSGRKSCNNVRTLCH